MKETIGTVISTFEGPSTTEFDFVIKNGSGLPPVNKGQFVQLEVENGLLIGRVDEIKKTNRYFMQAESVREYEKSGKPLMDMFPVDRWEYLVAKTKPLGVYNDGNLKRVTCPPSPGKDVERIDEEVLSEFLGLDSKGLNVGKIFFHDLDAKINLTKLFQKHLAVLAISGAGKCLDYETEVTLNTGKIVKIGELVDDLISKSNPKKEGNIEYIDNMKGYKVLSLDEDLKIKEVPIKAFARRKSPRKLLKIRLRSGKELIVTKKHPIPVLSKGEIVWKTAEDLKQSDRIATARVLPIKEKYQRINLLKSLVNKNEIYVDDIPGILKEIENICKERKLTKKDLAERLGLHYHALLYWFSKKTFPLRKLCKALDFLDLRDLINEVRVIRKKNSNRTIPSKIQIDENFARFLGYVFAESHNNGKKIMLSNEKDEIIDDFVKLGEDLFGINACVYSKDGIKVVVFNSSILAIVLRDVFGITKSARTKRVSNYLLMSPESVSLNFLQSLIDCDGYVSDKKPELEIAFSNKKAVRSVAQIFLKIGVLSKIVTKRRKTMKGKRKYYYLIIRGSKNLSLMHKKMKLKLTERGNRLKLRSKVKSNPNLDTVPEVGKLIKKLSKNMKISLNELARRSGTNQPNLVFYSNYKKSTSRKMLQKIVKGLRDRYQELKELDKMIDSIELPFVDKQLLLLRVSELKDKHDIMYKDIGSHCDVSATTVGRMISGRTAVTDNILKITTAMNSLLPEKEIFVPYVSEKRRIITKLKHIVQILNIPYYRIDGKCHFHRGACAEYIERMCRTPDYKKLWKILTVIKYYYQALSKRLPKVLDKIDFLDNLANSDIFWDQIVKIEKVTKSRDYVYDLVLQDSHNFIANGVIVHNSHLISVFLEELLDRSKELGKPAVIVVDPHGEYSGFAEDENYSKRTKVYSKGSLSISTSSLSPYQIMEFLPHITSAQRRELIKVVRRLRKKKKYYGFRELIKAIEDSDIKTVTKETMLSWISTLRLTRLFSRRSRPYIKELAKPGQLSILDLSGFLRLKDKQILVTYFARKLFYARHNRKIPPFILVVEEAHQFVPEGIKSEHAISKGIIETIAREGRKFHASLVLVSQRPIRLSTTALSQCNTQILLRIVNPYDLKHIQESSEAITSDLIKTLPGLEVGEAIITGNAVNHPLFVKVRQRKSKESERLGINFEDALRSFNSRAIMKEGDLDAFM